MQKDTRSVEQVLEFALKLSPRQRVQLIERIASSIEHDIELEPTNDLSSEERWGEMLVRKMNEWGPIEMIHPEFEDATEWVKQIRRDQELKRGLNWDEARSKLG